MSQILKSERSKGSQHPTYSMPSKGDPSANLDVLRAQADESPATMRLLQLQSRATVQRQDDEDLFQGKFEGAPSNGGLPAKLKAGMEGLSGTSMDDVRVHYNSAKPAAVQAHAYAQGSNIYLGSGQEKHLAHEAWHTIQQKQGRVQPTVQAGDVAINDDPALEREADVMGAKASQMPLKS